MSNNPALIHPNPFDVISQVEKVEIIPSCNTQQSFQAAMEPSADNIVAMDA